MLSGSKKKETAAYVRFLYEKRSQGFAVIASKLRMDEDEVEELYDYARLWNIHPENR